MQTEARQTTRLRTLLVVATSNWRQRLAGAVGQSASQLLWAESVYEATAIAAGLNQKNESLIMVILIDSLNANEMGVFQTLKRFDRLQTIAVSVMEKQSKMDLAYESGANEVMTMNQLHCLGSGIHQIGEEEPERQEHVSRFSQVDFEEEQFGKGQREGLASTEIESLADKARTLRLTSMAGRDNKAIPLRANRQPLIIDKRRLKEDTGLSSKELETLLGE